MATRSIRLFCRSVAEDLEYRETVLQRARNGTLGSLEPVILAYAYGPPKIAVDLTLAEREDLSQLSTDELSRRAAELSSLLQEASELEAAIPAEYQLTASDSTAADEISISSPQPPEPQKPDL
jgi:hypothetical protein